MKCYKPMALLFAALFTTHLIAADGPSPFPNDKDEAAWLGKGPIRSFGWMVDNRNYFWTQREKDQGAVVFIGDSLTGNWETLAQSFPDVKVANRGIGGDTSRGVLFRFREDVRRPGWRLTSLVWSTLKSMSRASLASMRCLIPSTRRRAGGSKNLSRRHCRNGPATRLSSVTSSPMNLTTKTFSRSSRLLRPASMLANDVSCRG